MYCLPDWIIRRLIKSLKYVPDFQSMSQDNQMRILKVLLLILFIIRKIINSKCTVTDNKISPSLHVHCRMDFGQIIVKNAKEKFAPALKLQEEPNLHFHSRKAYF